MSWNELGGIFFVIAICTGVVSLLIRLYYKHTFWFRVKKAKLLHALFDVHSPSGLELHGCALHGWRSREEYLKDLDTVYEAGIRAGRMMEKVLSTTSRIKGK